MLRFAKHDQPKLGTRRALGFGLAILCVAGGSLTACSSTESEMTATTEAAAEAEGTTTTAAPATLPSVSNVFAPPTEAGQDVMVSLSITGGATQDALVGVSVSEDLAESATLVPDEPVSLVPSKTVNLTKSGAYIELVGLKKALDLNRPFEITLEFENSAEQTVQGGVRQISLGST
jgi:copper(I)-binding protein